jgi:hypothetical protein
MVLPRNVSARILRLSFGDDRRRLRELVDRVGADVTASHFHVIA